MARQNVPRRDTWQERGAKDSRTHRSDSVYPAPRITAGCYPTRTNKTQTQIHLATLVITVPTFPTMTRGTPTAMGKAMPATMMWMGMVRARGV